MTNENDITTAKFAIRSVLIKCSHYVPFDPSTNIETIVEEIYKEITDSSCSHAFQKLLAPDKNDMSYDEICYALKIMPRTWIPALLKLLVSISYHKNIWQNNNSCSEFVEELKRRIKMSSDRVHYQKINKDLFMKLACCFYYQLSDEVGDDIEEQLLEMVSKEPDFNEGSSDLESYLYDVARTSGWLAKED